MQAVAFTDGACPVTPRTILTYSQSANARSPFYADQTRMYSRKQWNPVPFCRPDVLAQTVSTTRLGAGKACVARTRARARVGAAARARRAGALGRRRARDGRRAAGRAPRGAPARPARGGRPWRGRRPGVYVVRVRKGGDTRRIGVLRSGGRVRVVRFERRARCARVRSLSLGSPVFRRRLTIRYRLAARARVRHHDPPRRPRGARGPPPRRALRAGPRAGPPAAAPTG